MGGWVSWTAPASRQVNCPCNSAYASNRQASRHAFAGATLQPPAQVHSLGCWVGARGRLQHHRQRAGQAITPWASPQAARAVQVVKMLYLQRDTLGVGSGYTGPHGMDRMR